ncbi:ABC transporter substrate-binding protein [Myxococcota bacterium]
MTQSGLTDPTRLLRMSITRPPGSPGTALRRMWSVAAMGLLFSTLSCADADDNSNTVAIGLLLPFSGTHSATSTNLERAVIQATERVNAGGGIRGKQVRLIAADTHSSASRSVESAQYLIDEGVVTILGMESSDIAATLEPLLYEHSVPLVSPLVGTADDALVDCTDLWFRLAPAAHTLGEALAKELSSLHVPSIVVLNETDAYSRAFSTAVISRFESLEGNVALRLELDPTEYSYAALIDEVHGTGVPNVVLATSPRTASLVVNEFYVTASAHLNWYLSPLLKTHLLIQDVAPQALNGARGVAPKIYETRDTFERAFQRRWEGDLPLEGAYFYYDATAIVAYALQASALPPEEALEEAPEEALEEAPEEALEEALEEAPEEAATSADAFRQSVLRVTTTLGVARGWNELGRGLESLEAGQSVYYTGLTGPILFDPCGARKIGTFGTWTVHDGHIVDVPRE